MFLNGGPTVTGPASRCRTDPRDPTTARTRPHSKWHGELMGHTFVHSVIDDHSRVVYSEVHDDETALTATVVLVWASDWFAACGITIER